MENIKYTTEDFGIGQTVNVKADGEYVFHDFTGTVKGYHGEFVIVEDQDGDCFDCNPEQLSYNSDEYMH